MRKWSKLVLFLSLIAVFTIGCSDQGASDSNTNSNANSNANTDANSNTNSDENSDEKVTLSLFSTVTNEKDQETLDNVIAKFEDENPNIDIEQNYPGSEYESLLRVKMAGNDMPDLFDTHGWAQKRYGEYVADLSDMDWVQHLDPALDQIFKDDAGKVYAYPLNQAKDGITYNASVLERFDIDPPSTFDEFMTALETIKEKSNGEIAPLWIAGGDTWPFGQFFDEFATPLMITHPDHDYSQELMDGTVDWSNYTYLPEKLKEMYDNGLLNVDALTAKYQQVNELLAQEKIVFVMGGVPGPAVEELNPDTKLGVIPVPSIHEGGVQSWIGGERQTMAVWKDTDYPDEAKKFIEFLTQPEIVKEIAEGTSLPAGLTNTEADNYYADYYKQYADIKVEPYFDRIFLPSGMWDVMSSTGEELISGSMTPDEVSEKMGEEYTRLREQN